MKKTILWTVMTGCFLFFGSAMAQKVRNIQVPPAACSALLKKYPGAIRVTWEKENDNFEVN